MTALEHNLCSDTLAPPQEVLEVDSVAHRARSEQADSYSTETRRFTLTDGSSYDVQHFRPKQPLYDVGVTYTTPWCTDLAGFNELAGAALAQEGIPVIAVSPERLRPGQLRQRLGNLSLMHDVLAHHAVLNFVDTTEIATVAPRQIISIGYSRGAMEGFGFNATSMGQGRDVRYSDYVDPTLEHLVRVRDINWKEIPGYLAEEGLALSKGLSHYTASELLPIAGAALKPNVCFWLQQLALTKTLFSGEAGTFVEGWHPDSVANVVLYTKSRFNHADQWRQRFAELPNVNLTAEPGLHLSGADPKVLKRTVARVLLAESLIRDHASPAELHEAIAAWQSPAKRTKTALAHFPRLRSV